MFAPVTLFVYNRLDTTRKTVYNLALNELAPETDLIIYSDGGKDEVSWGKVYKLRSYLKTINGFKSVTIIERDENYYLEKNIIEGVTEVINKYGKVIVLEDDILTNKYYLNYMNDALTLYENKLRVMHVSSLNHFDIHTGYDANFTSLMEGWGWGTWKNRWSLFKHFKSKTEALHGLSEEDFNKIEYGGRFKCLHTLDYNPIPWDICWMIAIYKNNGLCLEPSYPLSQNIGLYNGTHYNNSRLLGRYKYDKPFVTVEIKKFPSEIENNEEVETLLNTSFEGFGMKYNLLGKILRYFYHLKK
jgi:hypothetical protein